MKKSDLKALEKNRKKIIKVAIEENLIERIKQSISELGYDAKVAKKEISKSAKLVAKKISAKVKLSKEDLENSAKAEGKSANKSPKEEADFGIFAPGNENGKKEVAEPVLSNTEEQSTRSVDPLALSQDTEPNQDQDEERSQQEPAAERIGS